jgi:hypothetical protein
MAAAIGSSSGSRTDSRLWSRLPPAKRRLKYFQRLMPYGIVSKNDRTKPGTLGLPNHARNRKVRAETCDASRPTPNARVAGRQEPPCSASTPPPTQLPAQPKPRSVLHETLQSCDGFLEKIGDYTSRSRHRPSCPPGAPWLTQRGPYGGFLGWRDRRPANNHRRAQSSRALSHFFFAAGLGPQEALRFSLPVFVSRTAAFHWQSSRPRHANSSLSVLQAGGLGAFV